MSDFADIDITDLLWIKEEANSIYRKGKNYRRHFSREISVLNIENGNVFYTPHFYNWQNHVFQNENYSCIEFLQKQDFSKCRINEMVRKIRNVFLDFTPRFV
jgi:hypothetical protein